MGRKKIKESIYRCPFCGTGNTAVTSSVPYKDMIFRKRRCILCGEEHTTTEFPTNVANILQAMLKVIKEKEEK